MTITESKESILFSSSQKILLLIMIVLVDVSLLHASTNPFESKLPFKEGIVHYIITGSTQGTQTTYIRKNGKERVIYKNTHSKIMHQTKEQEDIIMITPKWTYHLNLIEKSATKEPSLNKLLITKFRHLTTKQQQKILKKETTTMLNLPVIAYSVRGEKRSVTKQGNLLLASQTDIVGYKVKTMATNIEKKDVNDSLFILPKDITIVEKKADESMADHIVDALLSEDSDHTKKAKLDYQSIIQEGIHSLDF